MLDTGVGDYIVNRGIELIGELFNQIIISRGISDEEIERVFKDVNHSDLSENFLGVFPSDKISKFVMFEKIMHEKQYSFIISNTGRKDQPGTHWWSIWNISPTSELLFFDSLGVAGRKNFIVKDNKKIINKVLKRIEKMDRVGQRLTLQRLKFLMQGQGKLKNISLTNELLFFDSFG